MVKGLAARVFGVLLPLLFLLSCGIETYYYLPPVPAVSTSANTYATINLPDISTYSYFTHFALYYRIYISNSNAGVSSYDAASLNLINSMLSADYQALLPYTSTTNTSTANMAVVMGNRGYQPLFFETGSGISSDILTTSPPGFVFNISFQPSGSIAHPEFSSTPPAISYYLKRSTGGGTVVPEDRYFNYNSGLHTGKTPTINTDVVDTSDAIKDYAYAAVYIVTTGLNDQTFAPVYSIPTFVGIFRLP
jgi:hypothetical protein